VGKWHYSCIYSNDGRIGILNVYVIIAIIQITYIF
jgi:hypothetical protein